MSREKGIYQIEFEKSPKDGEFYTRVIHPNGNVIYDGGQGYKREAKANTAFDNFAEAIKEGRFKNEGDTHNSEKGLPEELKSDYILLNNGDLDELSHDTLDLWPHIENFFGLKEEGKEV